MGKNTDKLYITQTEHSGVHGWHGGMSGIAQKNSTASYKQLPFNYCSLSLQPFNHPCCLVDETKQAIIFDFRFIVPWLRKHGTNPINGQKASMSDLIKLKFAKNSAEEYCDPVTMKSFTRFSHIVAIRSTGNCFSWDTIERLNIKPKHWRDLVNEEQFTRDDIITIQDPHNVENRDFSAIQKQKETARDEKITKAKIALQASRAKSTESTSSPELSHSLDSSKSIASDMPIHRASHTTGYAAASLTSTSFTPVTKNERAIIAEEDYMLNHTRIKHKGYARIVTNHGEINIELHTDYAPHAVYNFVQLAKQGYYRNTIFHRNIARFMIQGGDPSGTGRGGQSIWGKPFKDEFCNPLKHDDRGIISMANRGKNTNGSQFFILYGPAKHLDNKHTIFGRVVGGLNVLDALEKVPTNSNDHPKLPIKLEDIIIFVDPFEEWKKDEREKEKRKRQEEEEENNLDRTSWTGRDLSASSTDHSLNASVGKYLKKEVSLEEKTFTSTVNPKKKKARTGFGNFDAW